MSTARLLIICCLLALDIPANADGPHAGPLLDRFPLTLAPGQRTEVLGPLFYSETNDTQKTWAFPPLMAHVKDPVTDFTEFDFLYPILTYDRYGPEYRW